MKEKTYFFNGMQKKIKLLATSLLCVGHAALLLATQYGRGIIANRTTTKTLDGIPIQQKFLCRHQRGQP